MFAKRKLFFLFEVIKSSVDLLSSRLVAVVLTIIFYLLPSMYYFTGKLTRLLTGS